ncbi:MAG TPA: sensor histidine kinase [Alphaproteobacteria bacterium]|nr:sensor histidine kinase [Alphaproteobacteria bacterium]
MHLVVWNSAFARDLPVWARYLAASLLVALVASAVRFLEGQGIDAPYLLLLAVLLCSAVLERCGLYAALLSSLVAYAFLAEKRESAAAVVSLLLFLFVAATTAVVIEILARRAAQAAKAERRKDLLLREALHRIKNNLQTITSLLRIQRRALRGEEARRAFDVALNRIHVMAAAHTRLVGTDERETIEMSEFLISLCGDFRKSMVGDREIAFAIDVHPSILDCARAAAVGFVINELVTNAVKYAFRDGRAGTIAVSFRPVGFEFELEVADDGSGMPADAKPGLGQTLIQLFARQLEGTIEVVPGPGTRHVLRFPVAAAAVAA